jgi:hypothetical protein
MIEREDHLHSWMFDKTGTISTGLLNHGEILQQEQISIRGVLDEVLQVHRVLPGRKEEEIDAAATSSKRFFFYHINLYIYIKFRIRILCVLLY